MTTSDVQFLARVWHPPRPSKWGPIDISRLGKPGSFWSWQPTEAAVGALLTSPATEHYVSTCVVRLDAQGIQVSSIPRQQSSSLSVAFVPVFTNVQDYSAQDIARIAWTDVECWRIMSAKNPARSYCVLQAPTHLLGFAPLDDRSLQKERNVELLQFVARQYEGLGLRCRDNESLARFVSEQIRVRSTAARTSGSTSLGDETTNPAADGA